MSYSISGYRTKFKLKQKVKNNIGDDSITMIIQSMQLSQAEGSEALRVLYLCGWFNGSTFQEAWLSEDYLKEYDGAPN